MSLFVLEQVNFVFFDVCDLNNIYNDSFQYSLPKTVLESYVSGKSFDHKELYTLKERQDLEDDIREIFDNIISQNPTHGNWAVMTAGAPGAGKTTKMRQELEELNWNAAYICPDDVCLKSQTHTFLKDLKTIGVNEENVAERLTLYTKWRPASNAATHLILANLIREKYNFYFGTTSTGPATFRFCDFLKQQGYQVRFIHISAPDDVRWDSLKERDKVFVQTTEQDTREKGLLLPQRIADTYLKYADQIDFYYRAAVSKDANLAARWVKGKGITVIDSEDYKKIKTLHNTAVEALNKPDLKWESTVEAN